MMRSLEEGVARTLFRVTDPEIAKTRRLSARAGRHLGADDPMAQLSRYTYVSADKQQDRSFAVYDTSRFALAGQAPPADGDGEARRDEARPKLQPIRVEQRVGRNDPCPCGSGKKYKKCCGADAD